MDRARAFDIRGSVLRRFIFGFILLFFCFSVFAQEEVTSVVDPRGKIIVTYNGIVYEFFSKVFREHFDIPAGYNWYIKQCDPDYEAELTETVDPVSGLKYSADFIRDYIESLQRAAKEEFGYTYIYGMSDLARDIEEAKITYRNGQPSDWPKNYSWIDPIQCYTDLETLYILCFGESLDRELFSEDIMRLAAMSYAVPHNFVSNIFSVLESKENSMASYLKFRYKEIGPK
jgi:hypothetical protein